MIEKFDKLNEWFDFMNGQFKKIEDTHNTGKINSILIDNDIDTIDYKAFPRRPYNDCNYLIKDCKQLKENQDQTLTNLFKSWKNES